MSREVRSRVAHEAGSRSGGGNERRARRQPSGSKGSPPPTIPRRSGRLLLLRSALARVVVYGPKALDASGGGLSDILVSISEALAGFEDPGRLGEDELSAGISSMSVGPTVLLLPVEETDIRAVEVWAWAGSLVVGVGLPVVDEVRVIPNRIRTKSIAKWSSVRSGAAAVSRSRINRSR